MLDLDTLGQLQVAAEAIAQIAQIFCDRSTLTFEELEVTNSNDGPVMPNDAFDRYVRQTMAVNFEPFLEPLASLQRKLSERQSRPGEPASVVGVLDQVALLQALDEQMSQKPGLTEMEASNQAIGLAHEEDVAAWCTAIAQWLRANLFKQPTRLTDLCRELPRSWVEIWLGLLLGCFELEQVGEFYQGEIFVRS